MYHRRGSLFQQYVVDGAVQIEKSNLSYQGNHHSELRAALYSGLADVLRMDLGLHASFVLPFNFCVVLYCVRRG